MENNNLPAKKENAFKALLQSESYQKRFREVLKDNTDSFVSSLINIYNGNEYLQRCNSRSILGAAVLAATLHLSITPSLGQAYVVPYKTKDGWQATFQIGVKGLLKLAHNSGQYTKIHAGKVFEGELRGFNPITGDYIIGQKVSDKIVGYIAFIRLVNGFEKTLFMSLDEIEKHALQYSQSYAADKRFNKKNSPWSTNFDAMATKTVLKKILHNFGILSTDVQTAPHADRTVVDKNSFTYVDGDGSVINRNEFFFPDSNKEIPTTATSVQNAIVDANIGEVVQDDLPVETETADAEPNQAVDAPAEVNS